MGIGIGIRDFFSSVLNPLIKPVYNVGDFGQDLDFQSLEAAQEVTTAQSITFSTATFSRTRSASQDPSVATLYNSIEEFYPAFASTINTGDILHLGSGANFAANYSYTPDMTAWLFKFGFQFAIGLNVSVYGGAGSVTLTNVKVTVTTVTGSSKKTYNVTNAPLVYTNGAGAGQFNLAGLGAAGTQIAIIADETETIPIERMKLLWNSPVNIKIEANVTDTGASTWQVGLIPLFPYYGLSSTNAKIFTQSSVFAHVHAAMEHSNFILNDINAKSKLDYGGLEYNG